MTSSLLLAGLLVGAAPAQAVVLPCGSTIDTPNTTVVLTADIECTSLFDVFGIRIAADNVTLDLGGHTIKGDGFQEFDISSTIGVLVTSASGNGNTANGAVVRNGIVTGFNTGVYLEQVFRARVSGMNLHDNIGPDATDIFGEGLQVFEGGSHVITGNQFVHNGPFAGVDIYGPTNNNVVTGNQSINNNIVSAAGHHGPDPVMQDIGIWLVNLNPNSTTTNNTISNNSVQGNGLDGIQVATFTNGNFVRSNSVNNNGFGQPAGNGFRDGDGIAIFGSSNVVEGNTANSNGGNGIAVHVTGNAANGKSNTIRANRAVANGNAPNSIAFDLKDENTSPPCDANVWTANTKITKNQACVN